MKNKILIIDDQTAIIKTLSEILADDNHKILFATSSKAAINIIAENIPDLILLDLKMPDMHGFELLNLLKLKKDTRDIPVIVITSDSSEETEIKGFKLGVVDFIPKPFDRPNVVLQRVKTQLKLRKTYEHLKNVIQLYENFVEKSNLIEKTKNNEIEKERRTLINDLNLMTDIKNLFD